MAEQSAEDEDRTIIGGSPLDRVVGMLLERVEAMRELHASMRDEAAKQRELIAGQAAIIAKLTEKLESHDRQDQINFSAVNASNTALGSKMDVLSAAITTATTTGLIQKAQMSAGWKVIAVIGAIVLAAIQVFSFFKK